MKKFLIYALGLVGVACVALLALDFACVALVKQSQGSSMYKMYRLFVDHPADEIPIFGSSRAASNYVPSLISPKAFCYGIDGSSMNETLFLLEHYLKQNPNGGPVLVNFDPWGFPKSHEGGFVADYTLSPISPKDGCRIPGIRMLGKLRTILAVWLNQRVSGTKHIDHGAVLQRISRTESEWIYIDARIADWGFNIDPFWRKRVEGLSKISRRTIVWVVGPCCNQWRSVFSGREDLVFLMKEFQVMSNMEVVDLYEMTLEDSYYMDDKHLNEQGAIVFTRKLMQFIY